MTTESEVVTELLLTIVESFTTHHEEIELTAKPVIGACYWTLKVSPEDYGKVAGRQGSHIKALKFLLAKLGMISFQMHYYIHLVQPMERVRTDPPPPNRINRYVPYDERDLLARWLEKILNGQFKLDIEGEAPDLKLVITPQDYEDYQELIKPYAVEDSEFTIIACLGTLFRAIGNKNGVMLKIAAKES
jgi:predicted RNA-binding protein YlqC (UPF0109 family)